MEARNFTNQGTNEGYVGPMLIEIRQHLMSDFPKGKRPSGSKSPIDASCPNGFSSAFPADKGIVPLDRVKSKVPVSFQLNGFGKKITPGAETKPNSIHPDVLAWHTCKKTAS
ncbi:hypothetical protein TWF730_002100 [Orbilia blumenaviensis]|uniref:Uncharacterized protein n=1 Tax=Orbilia blumenaviensis TaxID=1796055 RepID=A0AAV9UDW8_9PEZI